MPEVKYYLACLDHIIKKMDKDVLKVVFSP